MIFSALRSWILKLIHRLETCEIFTNSVDHSFEGCENAIRIFFFFFLCYIIGAESRIKINAEKNFLFCLHRILGNRSINDKSDLKEEN